MHRLLTLCMRMCTYTVYWLGGTWIVRDSVKPFRRWWSCYWEVILGFLSFTNSPIFHSRTVTEEQSHEDIQDTVFSGEQAVERASRATNSCPLKSGELLSAEEGNLYSGLIPTPDNTLLRESVSPASSLLRFAQRDRIYQWNLNSPSQ